jgi:transcriptional regulator with XRE-family HTH domain
MSPTPKQIGRRLKALREAAGLSQAAVAARADISREYLIRLEAGQHDPTVGTLQRLAKALNVPLLRLLD